MPTFESAGQRKKGRKRQRKRESERDDETEVQKRDG